MSSRIRASFVVLLLVAAAAFAADPPGDLIDRAMKAYANREYAASAALFRQAIEGGATDASLLYNAACATALAGRSDAALDLLSRAISGGYTDTAHMKRDTDLASIAGTERFQQLMATADAARARRERMWSSPAIATPYAEKLPVDQRLAGLSRIWSEAKFNFVYFELVPELDWDALYVSYLPRVRETESTLEYYRLLTSFLAQLHDGHTGVVPPRELWPMLWSAPGIRVASIEGRMIVTEALDPAVRELVGSEVTAVDGTPVDEYAKTYVVPYLSASTPQDLTARTARSLLQGAAGTSVELTLIDAAGKKSSRSLPRLSLDDLAKLRAAEAPFELRMLPGNVAWVALNQFGDSKAADAYLEHFPEIAKASALILDVRRNGGGNSGEGYRVLATLTDKPFRTSQWATRLYKPTYRAWGRGEETYEEPAGDVPANGTMLFTGPVVVLTSANTYSAAEDFVVAFDAMKRGTIVGEATGGSTGQPLMFRLPGGGSARVCTKRDAYPDGRRFVGLGIQPQVVVHPTVRDTRAGVDTVLEAAVKSLRVR